MARAKKNQEKFLSTEIHNPPEMFQYEADGYIVFVNILEDYVTVKPSSSRVYESRDYDLIHKWVNCVLIDGKVCEWENILLPIINYFKIDPETRKNLYSIFRDSTLAKINKSLRAAQGLYKFSKSKWQDLIAERRFIDARINGYKSIQKKLKRERSGPYKFLYPLLRPLFLKLQNEGFSDLDQCRKVGELFVLGEFDDFKILAELKNGRTSVDLILGRIQKYREGTLKRKSVI